MIQSTAFSEDRSVLRPLAEKVRKIAQDPENNEKKILIWKKHVSLHGEKPIVFVYPDGSWEELVPYGSLKCHNPAARSVECELRKRLIRYQYIGDDVPITAEVEVQKVIHNTMWGIPNRREYPANRGASRIIPVIEEPEDWKKLSFPVVTHDEKASAENLGWVQEAIGDLLTVRQVGVTDFSFHLMNTYSAYRGLDNMFYDLCDEPETVHEVMRFFTDGIKSMLRQYEEQNLISLNNNRTFHYTGGLGYTDELPAPGFREDHVRLCDVWGAAEAQEFAQISPAMHEEFVLQYERELLEPFGMNGYGCCDDLSGKLDGVLKIRNLRRVAVCPWADIAKFTPVLGKNYIMTWKPKPMTLAMDEFPEELIREELNAGIKKANGGVLELVLRDTHTCRNQPERFGKWVKIAREAIDENWDI